MSSPPVVEASGLSKSFDGDDAVSAVSFTVPSGTVLGVVGPNGAGKTTLIRMLVGLVAPTAGTGQILGYDLNDFGEVSHLVGATFPASGFERRATGRRNLRFLARLRGVSQARVDQVLDFVELADSADSAVGTYSTGTVQRLTLAAALMHEPRLLFLDEPFSGLDPEGARELLTLVARYQEEGRTLIVSSHRLRELAEICDHLLILRQGRPLFAGSVDQLHALSDISITVVQLKDDVSPALADWCTINGVEVSGRDIFVRGGDEQVSAVMTRALADGAVVRRVSSDSDEMETAVLQLLQRGGNSRA